METTYAPRGAARLRGRIGVWLRRYVPAEVAAVLGAVIAAAVADRFGVPAATAYAATIGEGVAFYAVILIRDVRVLSLAAGAHRPARRRAGVVQAMRGLAVEFGPAEVLDTAAVRPLAMLLGPMIVGNVTAGVVLGKVAADVIFYAIAIASFEMSRAAARKRQRDAIEAL
jgi:hypothetical protein